MKKPFLFLCFLSVVIFSYVYATYTHQKTLSQVEKIKIQNKSIEEIQEGDLIFHTSLSSQCEAVQITTKSIYSHCGIIFKKDNELYVFEAIQPVKWTRLNEWIARGKDHKYVIKRLVNSEKVITSESLENMKELANTFNGKNYDLTFEWTDDKMYCSEIIWKIYQRTTGIEIGKLEKLKDFDLTHPIVKQKLKERYGNKIPLNQTVISPASIFRCELLKTVKSV